MNCVVKVRQRVSLEEVAHMEQTLQLLNHLITVAHKTACHEVLKCHPAFGGLMRDYLTASIEQHNAVLQGFGLVNKMYRCIMEQAPEDTEQ